MKKITHESEYFYGNKISPYGLEHGYLDYATLAKAFDAVMVNSITELFYNYIGNIFIEPEQINGYIDNSDEIDDLQCKIDDLQNKIDELQDNICSTSSIIENIQTTKDAEIKTEELKEQIEELKEQIEELEMEQDEQHEIYQYFIVSSSGADIIQMFTNDPLYYIEALDIYIWGVTHWGTSWDYVLTDVKLNINKKRGVTK